VDVYDACYGAGTTRMWLCWEVLRVARYEALFERLGHLRAACERRLGGDLNQVARLEPFERVVLDRRCGLGRDALGNPVLADDHWVDAALLEKLRWFAALVGVGTD